MVESRGCYFEGDKQYHAYGSMWHPYLPPFGYMLCTLCTCSVRLILYGHSPHSTHISFSLVLASPLPPPKGGRACACLTFRVSVYSRSSVFRYD